MSFKFCPECAAPAEPGARFCAACGRSFGGASRASPVPVIGVVSLVVLLVLGAGFWLYFRLAPTPERPLKPGEGAAVASAGATGQPAAPAHPPMELPDDIKKYIADVAKKAEENPKDAEAWQVLARVYYRASRLDPSYEPLAEKAYTHLIELDAKSLEGLRGLGNLAYDKQDRATAISYYEKYLAISPDDAEVRTDLGTMYFETGDANRSIAEYDLVLEKNPRFYQAHFNLGVVYDAQGNREKAHAALEKARDLADDPAVKQRITSLLDAAKTSGGSLAQAAQAAARAQAGPAPAGSSPSAQSADTFAAAVEQVFRAHPIAGVKVVAVEWPEPTRARVMMREFPMEAMPDAMRESFLGKMSQGVRDASQKFGGTSTVTVELVDQPSGRVMATVKP
jgi:tetratricopeptide (TPR) repeat protein